MAAFGGASIESYLCFSLIDRWIMEFEPFVADEHVLRSQVGHGELKLFDVVLDRYSERDVVGDRAS